MSEEDELLKDKEHAKLKGFDNVFDWYLACLNAEVNILLDPALRTDDRLDELAKQAKIYIEKLAKAKKQEREKSCSTCVWIKEGFAPPKGNRSYDEFRCEIFPYLYWYQDERGRREMKMIRCDCWQTLKETERGKKCSG